jgi:hypothetical protein
MKKLLTDVKMGKWKGVLVVEVERLARGETMDQGIVAQAFKISETKIITPIKNIAYKISSILALSLLSFHFSFKLIFLLSTFSFSFIQI